MGVSRRFRMLRSRHIRGTGASIVRDVTKRLKVSGTRSEYIGEIILLRFPNFQNKVEHSRFPSGLALENLLTLLNISPVLGSLVKLLRESDIVF